MKTLALLLVLSGIYFFGNSDLNAHENPASTNDTNPKQTKTDQANNQAFKDLISSAPTNAEVFIIEPLDGATVSSPVTIKFGISNMSLAKAGDEIKNSGHHHLLIDMDELPAMDAPLPANDNIVHFGGGQTSTELTLEPGEHTLQLLLGDHLHIPHNPPAMSPRISIMVVEE